MYRKKLWTLSSQWPITIISYNRVVTRVSNKLRAWNCLLTLWEGDLSSLKGYKRSLSYAEGKPFDFMQSFYSALLWILFNSCLYYKEGNFWGKNFWGYMHQLQFKIFSNSVLKICWINHHIIYWNKTRQQ